MRFRDEASCDGPSYGASEASTCEDTDGISPRNRIPKVSKCSSDHGKRC